MLHKFDILPHEQAKTNLILMNAVAATIENNIERVYDFIVAEDGHLDFMQERPELSAYSKLVGYDIEIGPWNRPGATRITQLEGNSTIRETIIDCARPRYFQYMLTEFKGGWFEEAIDLGISTFTLSSYGPRTRVNWQYQMRPKSMDNLNDVQKFMNEMWYSWQQSYLKVLQDTLNKDPWSA